MTYRQLFDGRHLDKAKLLKVDTCFVPWVRNMAEIILSSDQAEAYSTIAQWFANGGCVTPKQKNPHLLTFAGFAGCGKSTCISLLAKEFGTAIRFAFCALSGKAASVLGKLLQDQGIKFGEDNHYCGTIHSLIYQPLENDKGEVIYWIKKDLLDCDIIVIDEASMISQDIFNDLCSYGKDILAVGDHGQLPPIEGNFSLMKDPDIKLEKIHRQAEDNPIINLSMQIREHGQIPQGYKSNEKVSVISKPSYINLLQNSFQGNKSPKELLDTAVLCYKNATRNNLNTIIRKVIFGAFSPVPLTNDLVICLRNNKNKKIPLYNGYRGYTAEVTREEGDFYCSRIKFPYEGITTHEIDMCRYQFGFPKTFSSFDELEKFGMQIVHWSEAGYLFDYGYALTVHKSQGSQFNNVILFNERPAPVSADNYKRWIYTAATRASDKLTIVL